MPRWGMVIDLKKCIGCWGCSLACKGEHFLPRGVLWNRVLIGERGKFPTTEKVMVPILCNHCEDPACVEVCPTGASFKRNDGIVMIDYDLCTGCRACAVACPYQQRTFLDGKNKEYFPGQGLTEFERMGQSLYPLQDGTVVKCNFCVERVERHEGNNLKPGVDREATPVCVNICPVKARVFGDLDDPRSNVSELIKTRKGKPFHPEFDTGPSVCYID